MLLVTIFLGGWALPFFHRDGLTIAFGSVQLAARARCSHLWMTLIGVLAFFGKVLVVCWVQVFVRWTLPRFRYDQLMKLGWTVLLPPSLANILVTGVVWLALDQAGPAGGRGAQGRGRRDAGVVVVAHRGTRRARWSSGFFGPVKHQRRPARARRPRCAAKRGGTKDDADAGVIEEKP